MSSDDKSDTAASENFDVEGFDSLIEYGYSPMQMKALRDHFLMNSLHRYPYPWETLGDGRQRQSGQAIYLVGYGSLLHPGSAARTISNTPAVGHMPVVAIGAKRIFNYIMPTSVLQRYGQSSDSLHRAALNVEPDRSAKSLINGRLIRIGTGDIAALREREVAYDLEPVSCLAWPGAEQTENVPYHAPFHAYVLSCPDRALEGKRYVDDSLLPYRPYFDLCRSGAAMVSQQFLTFFLNTTYLGDRQTLVADWKD